MTVTGSWFLRTRAWYRRIFSIEDLETQPALQWSFGALLLVFFITFADWINAPDLTKALAESGAHRCWAYFQNCGDFFFLETFPHGYSQQALYMGLFVLMFTAVYAMWRRQWTLAHVLMLVFFLWEFLAAYVLVQSLAANAILYHLILVAALLFLPHKLFFLKFTTALLYFLSATIKFSDAWIVGTYFSSLATGMPLVPEALIPLATNIVTLSQMLLAWALLSNTARTRITATAFFAAFHVYSGLFVLYRFVLTALPIELILFGFFPTPTERPRDKKAVVGWLFVLLLIGSQVVGIRVPSFPQLTREGSYPTLLMLEANHQCFSTTTTHFKNKGSFESRSEWPYAWNSCNPYGEYFRIKELCVRNSNITSVEWQFAHSVNGKPFLRIVDEANACMLNYSAWRHNTWIMTPLESPLVEGFPVENYYLGGRGL